MFLLRNFNFTCITFRGPALSQLLVSHVFIFAIFPKNHKIYMSEYVYMCVCVSVRVSSRVTRGRGGRSPLLFLKIQQKVARFWKKMA